MRASPSTQILISMVLGGLAGLLIHLNGFHELPWVQAVFIQGVFHVLGTLFLSSIKMLVVPLVLVSLVCGVSQVGSLASLSRIGGKTLLLYGVTTVIAISLGLFFGLVGRPGLGLELPTKMEFQIRESPTFVEIFLNIIPSNPMMALTEGNMLQVIFLALVVGLVLSKMGTRVSAIREFFTQSNQFMFEVTKLFMKFAPIGVFGLTAKAFSEIGIEGILPVGRYYLLVLSAVLFQLALTYPFLLKFFAQMSPVHFYKSMREALLFAFSSASSSATLPLTLNCVEKKLKIPNRIASFTIPLGTTINMDGTALRHGIAVCFVAQAYGISLAPTDYLMVILMSTLASVGAAGIPGTGLIVLVMVLRQVNLPVEILGLLFAVDRLIDMSLTVTNVAGDAVVTSIVHRSEKAKS